MPLSAGTNPVASVTTRAITEEYASSMRSGWTINSIGSGVGIRKPLSALVSHRLSKRPAPVPSKASNKLSVSNWRTRRPRLPPSDMRMASSRERVRARANSRLEMLAHAISTTIAVTITSIAKNASAGITIGPPISRKRSIPPIPLS